MHNLLAFPQSAEQDRRIIRIKAQILGTLRASELPGCYLRKPVSLLDIRQYCEALNEPEEPWVCGTGELLADGLITTKSRNGHLFLTLRSAPLPPDYDQRDMGDETDQPRTLAEIAGPLAQQELDHNRRNYLREIDDEITDAPAERELWRNR